MKLTAPDSVIPVPSIAPPIRFFVTDCVTKESAYVLDAELYEFLAIIESTMYDTAPFGNLII